jgi:RHS repeat-associated protein
VKWVHQDPVVKSQRLTDASGSLQAVVELDPWGGETTRSWQQGQQPQRYTTYLRDGNESDEAQMRRYNRWWSRFDQPDPFDGSYRLADPQSLNRYSYVQNDPVNFVDPSGLEQCWGLFWVNGDGTFTFTGTVTRCAAEGPAFYGLPGFGRNDGGIVQPVASGDAATQNSITQQNPNVCADMAQIAQGYANDAIGAARDNLKAALQKFDQNFSRFFVGSSIGSTYRSAYDLWRASRNGSLRPQADEFFRGTSGFKDGYIDSRRPHEDQTHHFGAYLSAGINDQQGAAFGHILGDVAQRNWGDRKLGIAARNIGTALRLDPSLLRTIGERIRNDICK